MNLCVKMACQPVYTWSFSCLVAAFLDLSITFFLLCASAAAFMASKFLGVFGLSLPCPCHGILGMYLNKNLCFQKLCVEYPLEKISDVQLSVRSRFPFNDTVLIRHQNCDFNMKLLRDKEREFIELDGGGASCSEVSIARESSNIVSFNEELDARNEVGSGAVKVLGTKEGRFDMKGKGIMHHRQSRSGFRRRRKGSFDHAKYLSIGSYNSALGGVQSYPESPSSINGGTDKFASDGIDKFASDGFVKSGDETDAPAFMKSGQVVSNSIESTEVSNDDACTDKDVTSSRVLKHDDQGRLIIDNGDSSTIRLLEQALEKKHAAYSALCLELEKERSAAASAAEEAMAMIQRLQEEKASIEIEARQYERILEEKSAYDAEEMNILEEIIIRREMEKHFLEKEVEACREIISSALDQSTGTEVYAVDTGPQTLDSSIDSSDDPVPISYRLRASMDKKAMAGCRQLKEVFSSSNQADPVWENQPIQGRDEDAGLPKKDSISQFFVHGSTECQKLQDKMVTVDKSSISGDIIKEDTSIQSCKPGSSLGRFLQEDINTVGSDKEYVNDEEPHDVVDHSRSEEPYVHDVHVIVGQGDSLNQVSTSRNPWMLSRSTSEVNVRTDVSSEASFYEQSNTVSDSEDSSRLDSEVDVMRCSSGMSSRLPPRGPKSKSLRRDSMSIIENERQRIDNEIGLLREKLKIVQEGKEKLHLSIEHGEKGWKRLNLLDDIAHELKEIRQLTGRGKAARQASLPLPSSKAILKKRRCRSVSLGHQMSS